MNLGNVIRIALVLSVTAGILPSASTAAENVVPDADGCWVTDSHHVFMGKERCLFGVEPSDRTHAHLSGLAGKAWLMAAIWVSLHPHGHLVLTLDSDGGNMDTAMDLRNSVLRQGDVETVVETGKYCRSACTVVWLAGSVRVVEPMAFVVFHGVTCNGRCEARDITRAGKLEHELLRLARDREPDLALRLVGNDVFRLHGNNAVAFRRDERGRWLSYKVE